MEFRELKAEEIDLRVGNITAKGYTLLLYKNARCDMAILDETVGSENWQRKHYEVKDNMYCSVGIWSESKQQWIWKDDCGTESNTEKEKGEASDSFKRACVNWGIGRELYTSPFVFIPCKTKERENAKGYDLPADEKYKRFKVAEIGYNNHEITRLVITDSDGVVAYSFGVKKEQPKQEEVVGGSYVLKSGKYADKTIDQIIDEDLDYIQYCITNGKNPTILQNMIKALEDRGIKPASISI